MEYHGNVAGREARLRIEKQGVYLGERLLDYADVAALRPINHRVLIETIAGETIEISMLGFAYDGFWDELTRCFGARSLEALFVEAVRGGIHHAGRQRARLDCALCRQRMHFAAKLPRRAHCAMLYRNYLPERIQYHYHHALRRTIHHRQNGL